MVDVSVPAPELALSEQPRTQVDASAFNRPMKVGIASGLEQLGAGAEDLAGDFAKTQAATDVKNMAVTLDASGVPQVATPQNSLILGRAGEQYQQAFIQGEKARLSSDVTDHLTAIHLANETDPQAFHVASQAYVDALRNNTTYGPEVGNSLADMAANEASQRYANISEKVFELNTKAGEQAIQTNITDSQNKLNVLARQGAIGTDTYRDLQAQLMSSYDALGGTKLFGYSSERIESLKATANSDLNAQYIVGRVDDTFNRKGKAAALEALNSGIVNNPDLHIGDDERKQFAQWGMARLSYLTGEQKAAVDAGKEALNTTKDALRKDPNAIPPAVVDQIIAQARSVGDAEGASQLAAVVSTLPFHRNTNGLSPEESFNAAMGGGTYFQKLGQQENNTGNPNAGNGGGTYQFTPSTWATMMRTHPELGLTADGRNDAAQGQRAIVAFTNDNKAALQAAGIQPNDANTYMAHFLGAGGATSFIKAMQANPNALAAASNLAAATANPTIFYKGGDTSQPRTLQEVYDLQTRRFGTGTSPVTPPTSANGIPFTPEQMKANPYLASEYVRTLATNQANVERLGATIGEGLRVQALGGNPPDPTTYANFMQAATMYPDKLGPLAEKVKNAVVANGSVTQAYSQGGALSGQALVDQAQQIATSQPSIMHTQIAEAFQAANKRQVEALKNTPWEEGSHLTWFKQPAPLDFSSQQGQQALPQAMQDRATAAAILGSRTQNASVSAFSPAELPAVKSLMTNGTIDQRTALLGSIANANMSEPVLKATLGQLASSKETLPLAVAGSLVRDNPDAARSVIEGHALMQTEPKLAPNKDDFPGELAKAIPFNDLPATTMREGIDGAVQATYAKMSAVANDTTGVLNPTRLQSAITQVTGGVLDSRGAKIIAPWYGASQDNYDTAIRFLSDADFKGARTTDGQPFPAAALKPSFSAAFTWSGWRLQSAGDGKYLVFSGADDRRQYLGNAQGGKFVLDLGSKRAAVNAASSGSASRTPFGDMPFSTMPVGGPM